MSSTTVTADAIVTAIADMVIETGNAADRYEADDTARNLLGQDPAGCMERQAAEWLAFRLGDTEFAGTVALAITERTLF